MALWTKGTVQKDLTQVFETQHYLTLSCLLNCVQTERRDYCSVLATLDFLFYFFLLYLNCRHTKNEQNKFTCCDQG